ncbi:MAG: hypothetical protein ABJF11_19620 [Reichenbachiella sp.]|uniref:hypothetical protein n=1 Tax=Reichenbachiella sp. TaxID=2184521 RepID=UPI003264F198
MTKEEREKLRKEYLAAPLIPINISSYNKAIMLLYKRIIMPKVILAFLILILLLITVLTWILEVMPLSHSAIMGSGWSAAFILLYPPFFVYVRLIQAKRNSKHGLRKFDYLKDI